MASIEQAQKLILELLKDFEEDTLEILRHSPVAVRIMNVSNRHITFANPRYMENGARIQSKFIKSRIAKKYF